MITNELIIFKKDTDAPGSNRGFIYQYLKTLLAWLNNYKNKRNTKIYCEVDDDIKEINLMEQTIRFTQLKCYSTALNINSDEIKKSFYNYFVLHLIYEEYEGEYVFETNTHVSNRDTIIEKWMAYQGNLHTNKEIQAMCIEKTKEILYVVFANEKETMKTAINKKIIARQEKMKNASSENEELQLEIEKLDKELEVLQKLATTFEGKIADDEIMKDFTNRITWIFENVEAVDSIDVLKEEVCAELKAVSNDDSRVDLYLGRLLTEINFKTIKEEKEQRFLDNDLLANILNETDGAIRSGIDKEVLKEFDMIGIKMDDGFSSVIQNVRDSEKRIIENIDSFESRLQEQLQPTTDEVEHHFFEMPLIKSEEVKEFLEQEDNHEQSILETKIHKIQGLDEETRKNLLHTATESRCRYLMYLQKLKIRGFHKEYDEIKKLEKKVEGICTDALVEMQLESEVKPARFYIDFKKELKQALKEFNELVKVKKFAVDIETVYGQMFHMAAKCSLRWHRGE